MKKYICIFLAILVSVSICGCATHDSEQLNTRDYVAMDTVFTLRTGGVTPQSGETVKIDDIFDECEQLTSDLENVLSATVTGSDVYILNTEINALFDADPVFTDVLSVALEITELTGGAYDPAIGVLTTLWNVKGGGPVPTEDQIRSALAVSGAELLEISGDSVLKSELKTRLDLGGIGKGYAAQKLAEHLFDSGVSYGIISAGRTVGVFGDKPDGTPFKIGIADPSDTENVVGYLYTESGFVSVTGDYEQYFEEDGVRYHHIIDPETGYPSDSGISSVAVLSQNGAAADALSTALMVMGYDAGMEFYRSGSMPFEAVFIGTDGSVKLTDGLTEDRFEMSETYKAVKNSIITTANTSCDTASSNTVNTTVGTSGTEISENTGK